MQRLLIMKQPPEYEIEHVRDFLNVPEDRIDQCLEEFKGFIEFVRNMMMANDLRSEALGLENKSECRSYTWIDDGKLDATIRFIANKD